MSQYDAADPLTVLRANDLPVQPDPAFAARLRTRLEAALAAPANIGGVEMRGTWLRSPFRSRRAVPIPSEPRTVKLRTVVAAAVVSVLLLGFGWVWSLSQSGFSASTSESYKAGDAAESAPPAGGVETRNAPSAPAPQQVPQDATVVPDIVTTGSLMIVVAKPSQAADRLVSAVTAAGGRVDSRSEQSGSSSPTVNLVLRIPPDKVDAVLADAKNLGAVESMSINHTDVTSQRVDLDARIQALQTSVTRLLELMSRAGDIADLLAAESALTERQAELDSLRAQRAQLGDEIAYATINVNLSAEPTVERGGFLGALADGWQSMLSAAHAVVVAVGFLLPWIPVLALLALVLRFVVRRRRKARPALAL